ncbi:hypothetical protein [Asticcacaulis taihuensis]|uniref:hypothetical protein n=1 Tax=Asticcacaulis taihuensis TaxID=260084 RepID=UPI003F7B99C5
MVKSRSIWILGMAVVVAASTGPAEAQTLQGNNGPPAILQRRPLPPAPVQWQAVLDRLARIRASRQGPGVVARLVKSELDKTELPVLLPREGVLDTAKARLMSFGDAYALDLPQPKGVHIMAYGNRTFLPAPAGAVSRRPITRLKDVAEDIRITQMEDGWTATFSRYGMVYSLDVSCDDTAAPECRTDGYLKTVITQFDDVGLGARAQAEAERFRANANQTGSLVDQLTKSFRDLTKGG